VIHRYVPALVTVKIYAGLGEKDRACEWLGKGYEDRDTFRPSPRSPALRPALRRPAQAHELATVSGRRLFQNHCFRDPSASLWVVGASI